MLDLGTVLLSAVVILFGFFLITIGFFNVADAIREGHEERCKDNDS